MNAAASAHAPIDGATLAAIAALYERLVKVHVHQRW